MTLQNRRILIVDDSAENISVLGSILKNEGYEVLAAGSAVRGLSIAEVKIPDLILLDIMMPGVDGFEAYRRLKANKITCDIPVVFLSALSDEKSVATGLELGAVDYIYKPFNKTELLARIKNQLLIKLTNEHNKALFENSHQTYIMLNKDFEIINYNNIANTREELFGKSSLQAGENILNYVSPEDHAQFKRKISNAFKGKISLLERKYGSGVAETWFKYIFEPIMNSKNEIFGCLINGIDITSKKSSELRVQEYTHQLKEVFQETQQSLEFASYIQNAIFPTRKDFNMCFKESFLIYKPKDIVSGDFYWMHSFGTKVLFVMGDCTGHGVPGALLTTISVLLLERIVKFDSIISPEDILYEIDENLNETLKNDNSTFANGMELAVCLFDRKKKTLEYAGARRSLFMIKEGQMHELKGSRQDLGGNLTKVFKKQKVRYTDNTLFYLFSDGATDQMGGINNKKFLKQNLLKLIHLNCQEPMKEQKHIYEHAFAEWMKNTIQTDDITLIGLKPL